MAPKGNCCQVVEPTTRVVNVVRRKGKFAAQKKVLTPVVKLKSLAQKTVTKAKEIAWVLLAFRC